MGDFIQGSDIFKKIGLDESNQWVVYDESYQIFFSWFTASVKNNNTLTELEILEMNDLRKDGEYIQGSELDNKMSELVKSYPNILNYEDVDALNFKIELQSKKEIYDMFYDLSQDIEKTKCALNRRVSNAEIKIQEISSQEDLLYKNCLQKARKLQELQKENRKYCLELNECIAKLNSPPLFTHQFPLEQYLLKCDSFMQYFSLYLQENFTFQNFSDTDRYEPFCDASSLEKLKNLIYSYNEKCVLAKTKLMGLQQMVEDQDSSKVHIINISNLKKEIKDLENLNGTSFDITYETLVNDLKLHLQQLAHQQIEFVLYQNTKTKIERAAKRLENINFVSKIISNVLKNSEIMWIMMQLDGEKLKNRIDNSDDILVESQNCLNRIDALRHIQVAATFNINEELFRKLSPFVGSYKNFKIPEGIMDFIDKFNKSLEVILENISSGVRYKEFTDILNSLKSSETDLSKYIFDGPTNRPMLENVSLLKKIFKSKNFQNIFQMSLRKLRSEFHDNISLMNSDRFLKNARLLWIWFLTEPKKVIDALEEIRKAAQNVSNSTGIKTLVGIKRLKD
ncbi:augmin complex subunit dgt3 [Condylostylus longicornis]|uniref:augmin complex subunit dgt3 n=1 Tax=Condylostylus longicornis TaxID=2530218 RepID=UPI00244DF5CA|nr:augmin complex subunit dgt3 [Condylostylus longicornis]